MNRKTRSGGGLTLPSLSSFVATPPEAACEVKGAMKGARGIETVDILSQIEEILSDKAGHSEGVIQAVSFAHESRVRTLVPHR